MTTFPNAQNLPAGAIPTYQTTSGSDGTAFSSSLPAVLAYNSDGTLKTITITDGTNTWVQTLTWTSGNLTATSAWVRQ